MKKKIESIVLSILLLLGTGTLFPVKTYAADVSISPSSIQVNIGDSVTVAVTIYGSDIYSYEGYIGCDDLFSGAEGYFMDDADGVGSVTLYYTFAAVREGTGSIYVSGCGVSDGGPIDYANDAACYITVLGNDNGSGGTGGGAGGWDYNDNYSYDWGAINGNEVGEGSGNTNLGSLEVEGYTVTNEGNGIFSVVVSGSVDKIMIKATAEDPAATVDGVGEKTLAEGDNYFDIVVYAENGLAQGYALKVTRRSTKIALTDLLTELKETKADQVTVSLKDGDKLTKEMIDAVAKWGKTLNLNRYDADGNLLYGWTLNGKEMAEAKEFKEFDPTVTFESKAADKINELSNFASGKILNFAFSGDLPKGTKFAFAAGKDFRKDDIVRLYYFDEKENKLTQVGEEVKVEDEVITVELEHCSEYFVTRALIAPKAEVKAEKNTKGLVNYIVMGVELAVIIALALFIILRMRRPNASSKEKKKTESHTDEFLNSFDMNEITDKK